jgi:RimJ/RimL family protein N-acetyltransferase
MGQDGFGGSGPLREDERVGEWNGVELDGLTLTTDRLTLRPFRSDDATGVLEAMQEPSMHEFLPLPDPYTEQSAANYVDEVATAGRASGTAIEAALVETSSGRLVGAASLRLPRPNRTEAEIGYAVYPVGRGHGYAAEATRTLTKWALDHDVARVTLRAAVGNVASIKSALNAGHRYEGIARAGAFTASGAHDAAVFGATAGAGLTAVAAIFPPLPAGGLRDAVISLRCVLPGDADALFEIEADPEVQRWGFHDHGPDRAKLIDAATQARLHWLVGRSARMVLVDIATDSVVGTLDVRLGGPPGVGGVGYNVHPSWRGRGYAARALRLLRPWAHDVAGIERLELGAKAENIASQRAAISGGCVPDGVNARRLGNPDGSFSDEVCFVSLR